MAPARRIALLGLAVLVGAAACTGGSEGSAPSLVVTDTGESHPRARAALAHGCVPAGGEQSLTVGVESGIGVGYVSTYADGEPGREPPHGRGYGGVGQGLSVDGALEESWTVSEEAPPGVVVVYVNALFPEDTVEVDPDQAFTRLRLSFLLVGPDEECPAGDPEIPVPDVVTEAGDDDGRVRATLEHECVSAGDGQTLTVESEDPGTVTYNTIYANGENGRPRPNGSGYGGSGFGVVGQEEVDLGWTIEENAPPGVAVVLMKVSATGDQAGEGVLPLELAFRVAGSGGECP